MNTLSQISLVQFRNYGLAHFAFNAPVTCVTGPNGSGKTNLLDAVYYLCYTKSYFTGTQQLLVHRGFDGFRVEGTFEQERREVIRCKWQAGKKEVWANGVPYERITDHIGKYAAVMIAPDDLLLMGRLGRPHGIRGDLKLTPETDDPTRFQALRRVYVGRTPETAVERAVENVRFQYPKGRVVVLVKLAGLATPEEADTLRNLNVYAAAADLPPLGEGEAFLHDLVGLDVWTVDDAGDPAEAIGTVRDLYDGAQLLFGIARPDGSLVLLPDVPEFVLAVDLPARRLLVRPPEGLIDDTAEEVEGDEEKPG